METCMHVHTIVLCMYIHACMFPYWCIICVAEGAGISIHRYIMMYMCVCVCCEGIYVFVHVYCVSGILYYTCRVWTKYRPTWKIGRIIIQTERDTGSFTLLRSRWGLLLCVPVWTQLECDAQSSSPFVLLSNVNEPVSPNYNVSAFSCRSIIRCLL